MRNRKCTLIAALFTIAATLWSDAGEPSLRQIKKIQGELRDFYRQAETSRLNFRQQTVTFPKKWNTRKQEMNRLLKLMSLPRIVPMTSVPGPSMMWSPRRRAVPLPVVTAQDYSVGPDGMVVPFSGELMDNAIDLAGINRGGIVFSLKRSYSSFSQYDCGFGVGWNFNYNSGIIIKGKNLDSAETLTFFTGNKDVSFKKKGGRWVPEVGAFLRLEKEGKLLTICSPDLVRYEFELAAEQVPGFQRWRLKTIASRHDNYHANRIEIAYLPECDRVQSILDPLREKYSFAYDAVGHIVQIASRKEVVSYAYGSSGKVLVQVRYTPFKLSLSAEDFSPEVNYQYLSGNKPLLQQKSCNSLNYSVKVKYDSQQRVVNIGFIAQDQQQVWRFAYLPDNVTAIKSPFPTPDAYYSFSHTTHPSLPSSIEIPAQQAKWQYRFNADFLLTSITEPLGNRKVRTYDSENVDALAHGNLLAEVHLPSPGLTSDLKCYGYKVSYHDKIALPVKVEHYQVANDGKETILKREYYEYSSGDLELIFCDDGGIKRYKAYNLFGLPVLEWDANKNVTISYYAQAMPDHYSFAFTNGDVSNGGPLVRIVQDATQAEIDAACETIKHEKISRNKITRVQPCSLKTLFAYDPFGNRIHSKSGFEETFSIFSQKGKLLVSCDAAAGLTEYQYFRSGRTSRIYHEFCPAEKQQYRGNIWPHFSDSFYYAEKFKYNSLGVLAEHQLTDECFDGRNAIYLYDRYPNGKIKKITNPVGVSRVDEYDLKTGRLQRLILIGGKMSLLLTSDFKYYPGGQVKSFINQFGGSTQFELDGFGQVVSTIDSKGVKTHHRRDGLGRIIEKASFFDGRKLRGKRFFYSPQNQKIESEKTWWNNGNKELETARYLYDEAGNLICKRGVRSDAWYYFLLDGCGDTVATRDPEGNIFVKVLQFGKPVFSASFMFKRDDSPVLTGSFTEYDFAGRPVRIAPIDSNNNLAERRSEIIAYNMVGKRVMTSIPELTTATFEYDTAGNTIREIVRPYSTAFGEAPQVTTYQYRADGQMLRKTFGNRALALRGKNHDVRPEFVDAPQRFEWQYDTLGRMVCTINPDGLVSRKVYNEFSLPSEIIWTHIGDEKKILRHLLLKYTVNGEIISIHDGVAKKLLRAYTYDELGNCVSAVDYCNARPVRLDRRFDSMNNMTMEKTSYGNLAFPWSRFDYMPHLGKSVSTWEAFSPPSTKYWCAETKIVDKIGRLAKISLDDSSNSFVSWDYLGNQCEKREIPESRITMRTAFTPLLEPKETVLAERSGGLLGRFEYDYGRQGQPIYAATTLKDGYKFAAYSQFDTYRRLVGQNGEAVVPVDRNEAAKRHKEIFRKKSDAVASVNTSWMVYDQANNIWGRYSGSQLPGITLEELKKMDRMPLFSSPANVIPGNSDITNLALRELASNRTTATAAYSRDHSLKATEMKYDRLGNLIEFEGTFWNGLRRYPVRWDLTFDTLGRLGKMKAIARETMGLVKKGDPIAELAFAYDAENRRILKRVTDRTRIAGVVTRSEVTLFRGNQQSLVFNLEGENKLKLKDEYLWGASERELLMAALRADQAENKNDFRYTRYFFQQDKSLNIALTSKVDSGAVVPVAAESYLGFGDNSTFAKITDIWSSMRGVNTSNAYNRRLDERLEASWGNPGGLQSMELQLSGENKLAQLTIWAKRFPSDFLVFVLPKGVNRPSPYDLEKWHNDPKHIEKYFAACVLNGEFDGRIMGDSLTSPYRLPLRELSGDRILLVFQSSGQHNINVREFEVVKVADNPSPIAFAGQWLDRETGMYYQINRYRLAGSDKFISPDPIGFMDGNNLYAYAKGNPLEWHDPDGQWGHILAGFGVGALFGGGGYLINCWLTGTEFSWAEFGIQTAIGAVSGAVGMATFGVGSFGLHGWQGALLAGVTSGGAAGVTAGGLDAGIHSYRDGDSTGDILTKTAWGAFKGGVTGSVAGGFASGVLQVLNAKPVQDVVNRALAIFRYGTGIEVTRRTAKGFLNAGLAGLMGGGSAGTVSGVFYGLETGDWSTIPSQTARGMIRGVTGALVAQATLSLGERYADKTWDKDRAAYWRNEAKNNSSNYSEADLARMRLGSAPQRINPLTGQVESMELHHDLIPQRSGLPKVFINQGHNLRKVWPDEHKMIDIYR